MILSNVKSTEKIFHKYFQKNFGGPQSQNHLSPKLSFWWSPMQFCIKIEKSPVLHNCDYRNRSMYRKSIWINLADRYDPWQAQKHPKYFSKIFCCTFFRVSRSKLPFNKTLFLTAIHAYLHQNWKITNHERLRP